MPLERSDVVSEEVASGPGPDVGSRDSAIPVSQAHIPELDGFRAIAVLMVLITHMFYGWNPLFPKRGTFIPSPVMGLISHGWLGVDLFFILSGFLITGILLDARERPNYFRNFYARRLLRIIPLYFTCILLMGLAYKTYWGYFGLSALFLANFALYFRARTPHGPSVFWSLAVEEHFYLVWPLLVRFLKRSQLFLLTLILVFGTPILRGYGAYKGMDPELAIYEYSWFRFDGLALGAILAMWVRSQYFDRRSAWKFAGFLVGFSLLITIAGLPFGILQAKTIASNAFRYTQAQFVFAAGMVLALAYRGTWATTFLRTRFTKLVAGLSYCLYLIHLAIGDGYYAVLRSVGFNDVAHFGIQGAIAVRMVVILALAFTLALLSKKFLEDPVLSLKRYF